MAGKKKSKSIKTQRGKKASWLPDDSLLNPFYDGIEEFVTNGLEPLLGMTDDEIEGLKTKTISIPTCDYVTLNPWEVAIIDTRLFQRLRRITQLGMAPQVYPGLGYDRFVHSLGVLKKADEVLRTLLQRYREPNEHDDRHYGQVVGVIQSEMNAFRLAALCHDLGHCVFSHASERVISRLQKIPNYPSPEEISECFTKKLRRAKKIPMAEVFTIAILSSKQMRGYLQRLGIPKVKGPTQVSTFVSKACNYILGLPGDGTTGTIFLGQLLSGGLDIDKFDYMLRESHDSGIPLQIDRVRLYDKLRVFPVQWERLPTDLDYMKKAVGENTGGGKETLLVLGIARGGQFAFEEFCLSRLTLYDKIYMHHKVRSTEVMLERGLEQLASQQEFMNRAHEWLYLEESDLLSRNAMLRESGAAGDIDLFTVAHEARPGTTILPKLRDRNLVNRAFAFGIQNCLSEPQYSVDMYADSKSWQCLDEVRKNPSLYEERIKEEISRIIEEVSFNDIEEAPEDSEVYNELLKNDYELFIDVPLPSRVQQGKDSLYFEQTESIRRRWYLPLDKVVSYYTASKITGFIFANKKIIELVMLASERVFYKEFKLVFEQEGLAPVEGSLKSETLRKVIYDTELREGYDILAPRSEILTSQASWESNEVICANLKDYKVGGFRVTPESVRSYVMQFPEDLQEDVLKLCEAIKVIEPIELVDKVVSEYHKHSSEGKIAVVPLGSPIDSAHHFTYYMKNVDGFEDAHTAVAPQLTDNVVLNSDVIIFYDDNINTGFQLAGIMAEWLNFDHDDLPDEFSNLEKHVQALGVEASEELRKKKVIFIYGVGPSSSEEKIKKLLVNTFKFNSKNVSVILNHKLTKEGRVLSGSENQLSLRNKDQLKKFLAKVGYEIVMNESRGDTELAKARELGDGGQEALIVFPYNTPTMTIYALWADGKLADGSSWRPLVMRRRGSGKRWISK